MESKDHILVSFSKELHTVRDHPRLLIILTHGFIEGLVDEIIKAKCKNGNEIEKSPFYSHSMKLIIMHEAGLLNDPLFDALSWFRRLRNRVVHDPFYKPNKSDAIAAKEKLMGFSPWIDRESVSHPVFWHMVCRTLQGALWNYHVDTMRDRFMK